MVEIRRINEGERETVAALWDEQARATPDGGPLPARGRRNIARMLEMAAWHEQELCLVAVDDGKIVGFVSASVSAGTGLLPGLLGEIEALYVTPQARDQGTSRALAETVVSELQTRGAATIRNLICIDDEDAQTFWRSCGFERDMVCLSLYKANRGRDRSHAAWEVCSPAASSGAPASCPPQHCSAATLRRGLRMPAAPIKPPAITSTLATPTPRRKASTEAPSEAVTIALAWRGGTPATDGRPSVSRLASATAA